MNSMIDDYCACKQTSQDVSSRIVQKQSESASQPKDHFFSGSQEQFRHSAVNLQLPAPAPAQHFAAVMAVAAGHIVRWNTELLSSAGSPKRPGKIQSSQRGLFSSGDGRDYRYLKLSLMRRSVP